jgi:CRISPR-associated protein (TIGR02584 family)
MTKNILLCVAGMTPQIITETLYAITQKRGERVDEIRVITTLDGRDKIMTGIVNGRGAPEESLLDPNVGQFYGFCRDFKIDPETIKFDEKSIALLRTPDGLNLADIREPKENEFAGNQICDIVRELTKDPDSRMHASAAGGRKTMSIYLTAAMQLFGRPQDTLSHVLVNEDFETRPDFYYPPPVARTLVNKRTGKKFSTDKAQIYLADIPFIRLRGILENWLQSGGPRYGDFVRQAQEELRLIESANDLKIDLAKYTIIIAGHAIKLQPQKFFYYVLFADLRKQLRGPNRDGFVTLHDIQIADLDAVSLLLTHNKSRVEKLQFSSGFAFLEKLIPWVKGSYVDPDFQQTFLEIKSKIKDCIGKRLANQALRDRFAIAADGERGETRYGLNLTPDRIFFE